MSITFYLLFLKEHVIFSESLKIKLELCNTSSKYKVW